MSLCCQSIVKHYGSVVALEDASITCEHGEIRAILGGNGSGKSTLAKAIGGVITKNAGKITIDGEEVNFSSPHEAKKTRCCFGFPGIESFQQSDGGGEYLCLLTAEEDRRGIG